MQYLPVDPIIEQTALYTGAVFAAVVLLGVYYYSGDARYKRWALSQLAFWAAFLPPSLFNGVPLFGDFLSMLLEVLGAIILLRALKTESSGEVETHWLPLLFSSSLTYVIIITFLIIKVSGLC